MIELTEHEVYLLDWIAKQARPVIECPSAVLCGLVDKGLVVKTFGCAAPDCTFEGMVTVTEAGWKEATGANHKKSD